MMKLIKWALRLGIVLWVGYWLAQIFIGDLGASPALKLNHELGDIVLVLLTANLLVGILMVVMNPPPKWVGFWLSERRYWGVAAFFVLVMHVGFYLLNEGFEGKAFVQMVTKTYLIFGMLGLVTMTMLAATSNDLSVRRLGGKRWKRWHRSVYLVQFFALAHVMLIEKADLQKYGIWLGGLLILQIARWLLVLARRRDRARPA